MLIVVFFLASISKWLYRFLILTPCKLFSTLGAWSPFTYVAWLHDKTAHGCCKLLSNCQPSVIDHFTGKAALYKFRDAIIWPGDGNFVMYKHDLKVGVFNCLTHAIQDARFWWTGQIVKRGKLPWFAFSLPNISLKTLSRFSTPSWRVGKRVRNTVFVYENLMSNNFRKTAVLKKKKTCELKLPNKGLY